MLKPTMKHADFKRELVYILVFAAGVILWPGFANAQEVTTANLKPKDANNSVIINNKAPQQMFEPELRKEKIAALYKEALVLFDEGNYKFAILTFQEILSLDPNHQQAKAYLEIVIPDILKKEKRKPLFREALGYFAKQDYQKASDTFKKVLARNPDNTEAKEYLKFRVPQGIEGQKQLIKEEKINSLYQEALTSFDNKEFEKASRLFKEVLSFDPNQAQAKEYLNSKIPEMLKENKETPQKQKVLQKQNKIKALYEQALTFYEERNYQKAIAIFNKILALDPNESRAKEYLEVKIPNSMREQERQKKISALYEEAIKFYDSANYERAAGIFKEILSLDSRQNAARVYLEKDIPLKLKEAEQKKRMPSIPPYAEALPSRPQPLINTQPSRPPLVIIPGRGL